MLVVSLGVDTFINDPIGRFKIETYHFPLIGSRIASSKLPTLFVLEGGYAMDEIGVNVVNILQGHETAA